jgi:polysaccharide biosynthesis transport protein
MNTQQSQLDILFKYLNLFIIRNKLIILCFLLAISLSYPVYLKSPKIYQSSVSIMFQISNINPSLRPSSARPSPDEGLEIREMVNTVSQKVLSRANLEKIIRQYDLYPEMQKNVPIEDIIARLREKDISVDVQQRQRGNVFSVSFKGAEPQTVMKVANEIAAIFIEENLKAREERAQQTATYIQNELQMSKETLQKKESQMRDYKLKYYNEMSEQRASNIARLSDLQRQFQAIQTNIDNREQTRLLLSEQLEIRRDIRSALARPTDHGSESDRGGLWDRLETARNTRQELLSRYTNEHPSVKRIENQIRQLESEIETLAAAAPDNAIDGDLAFDTRAQDIALQIKEIDIGLKTLREESENILSQIKTYQEWIDAAPIREAEWSALTRDYDELRRYHDTLLSQSLAAEAAASLERHQKGSQFKVIDPAYLPITPVKGPFRIFFLASAILGLAMGAGLILAFDVFVDTSFKDKNEVEAFLQVPVTCALPLLVTETEKRNKKIKDILWYCFFGAWFLILMAATLYLNRQGLLFL